MGTGPGINGNIGQPWYWRFNEGGGGVLMVTGTVINGLPRKRKIALDILIQKF